MLSRHHSRLAAVSLTRPATRSPLSSLHARSYSTPSSSSSGSPPRVKTTAFLSITLLTCAYLLYRYESEPEPESGSGSRSGKLLPSRKPTFQLSIRTGRGGVQTYEFERKPDDQVERELRAHEISRRIERKGNPVVRWDNNWLGSNEPCEDRWATDLVPGDGGGEQRAVGGRIREAVRFWTRWYKGDSIGLDSTLSNSDDDDGDDNGETARGKRDLMLFSIMDGHAGDATSSLLQKSLHPTISDALAGLQRGNVPHRHTVWGQWAGYLSPWYWLGTDKVWTPENVSKTIQNACVLEYVFEFVGIAN